MCACVSLWVFVGECVHLCVYVYVHVWIVYKNLQILKLMLLIGNIIVSS